MANNRHGRIEIVDSVKGVHLTEYLHVLSEILRHGTSASLHSLPRIYDQVETQSQNMSQDDVWSLYVALISGSAGLYLSRASDRPIVNIARRHLALQRVSRRNNDHDFSSESLSKVQIPTSVFATNAPHAIKIVDRDINAMSKELQKGGLRLPRFSVEPVQSFLSITDITILMRAIVSYFKAYSQ